MKLVRIFVLMILLIWSVKKIAGETTVLFSPDDRPTRKLLELINKAKTKIHAAIYILTDKQIAQALIDAKKRGVDVQLIVDRTSMENAFGKGTLLSQNNIETMVFSSLPEKEKRKFKPLMHHKFALIDKKLWTGSFNWTKSANIKNKETVIITDNQEVYAKYEKHFWELKKKCHRYQVTKTVYVKNKNPSWTEIFSGIYSKVSKFVKKSVALVT